MKANEIIYKKIPKFTNENYLYLYELILWDEINERQSQRTIKTRKDLFIYSTNSKKTKNYWNQIIKSMNEIDNKYSTISQRVSTLMTKYIKYKIKSSIISKIFNVSTQILRSVDYVTRVHLLICRFEIKNIKENLGKKDDNTALKLPDFAAEIDPQRKKASILNLFVGNFDMKKFLDHDQLIRMRKSEFVHTFIFTNNNNKKKKKGEAKSTNTIFSTTQKKYHDAGSSLSQPKIYGKKGKMYIYKFDNLQFSYHEKPNSYYNKTITTYNGFHDKKPKKSYSPYSTHTKVNLYNIEEMDEKDKNSKEIRGMTTKSTKREKFHSNLSTLTNNNPQKKYDKKQFYFPKIERFKSSQREVAHTFNLSGSEIKMENFLTKNDLYY